MSHLQIQKLCEKKVLFGILQGFFNITIMYTKFLWNFHRIPFEFSQNSIRILTEFHPNFLGIQLIKIPPEQWM